MEDTLTIPKKIRIGFQDRNDTYTGKLAYVIYFDNKGVLRKEKSWESWRDKKIDPQEFENEPTSGFVLNRGVGGARQSWGWNARNEYIRVYDPRGFEFEISVSNLLFILQECSAIKGKGLEGEFIYAWNGTELVLLPVCCQEYTKSLEHNELQVQKISSKDIVVGCTYLTKDQQEVIYLGRFDWYEYKTVKRIVIEKTPNPYNYRRERKVYDRILSSSKQHVFEYINTKKSIYSKYGKYWIQTGFTKIARRTSDTPIPQFADLFEVLKKSEYVNKPIKLSLGDSEVLMSELNRGYGRQLCVKVGDIYYLGWANLHYYGYAYKDDKKKAEEHYDIVCSYMASLDNGVYKEEDVSYDGRQWEVREISKEEVLAKVRTLYIECENGVKLKVGG